MAKARKIFEEIKKISQTGNGRIIVLTGARQVGKTFIVKEMLPQYKYISIEDPVLRGTYAALTAAQWHEMYPCAALDEVQKEPALIESIKSAYDQYGDVRYALLGSSQLLLLEKVKESLAGRCSIFDIYPLTIPELETSDISDSVPDSLWQRLLRGDSPEFLPSFLIDPDQAAKSAGLSHLLKFGGYPALVDGGMDDGARYRWLGGYVRTYLERDIRDLASFRDLEPFVKLQREMAVMTGRIFNASEVANNLKVSSKTIQRYLNYLSISYQAIVLPAWSRNAEKRLSKAPKVHLVDFGVQQVVLNKRGGMTGQEFESVIVSELFKQSKAILADAEFYHLRTLDGKEIDLIVETPNGYFAFEVKMAENVSATDARHLRNLEQTLDKPLLGSYVISNDPQTKDLGYGVRAVNAAMFLG